MDNIFPASANSLQDLAQCCYLVGGGAQQCALSVESITIKEDSD